MINGHTFYHFAIGRGFHLPCNRANASDEKKKENETFQVACEQALHLGESREVTREQHAKGNASARGAPRLRVLSRLALLAIHEELASRLLSRVLIF